VTHTATVEVVGVKLVYETLGEPADPLLVLIAGLGAQLVIWDVAFCTALAKRGHQVVRFDNRDVGLSTRFPAGGYSVADMADDTAGLIQRLGLDSAYVVGQSLGGMIAQELAVRHPDRVRSLCLISSTPSLTYFLPEGVAALVGGGEPPRNRQEAIDQFVLRETRFAGPLYPIDLDRTSQVAGQMWDRDPDPSGGGRQLAAIISAPDRLPSLAGIRCPTAVIHGDADPLISPAAAEALAGTIPGALLHIFPGLGHQLPATLWPEIIELIVASAAL
jgi:pimeloyl-ACP methyl ester carboxylesterase